MSGDNSGALSRRAFVRASLSAMAVTAAALPDAPVLGAALPDSVSATVAVRTTRWLGRGWWGNRMQDWVRRGRRLDCVAAAGSRYGRTVSALTWEVVRPSVVLRVRTGTLTRGQGFSGFVVGTGRRGDDWRARVLVGAASGEAGGFLATYESDGSVRFREHTSERHQLRYAEIPSARRRYAGPRRPDENVTLELAVRRRAGQRSVLLLRAFDTRSGRLLASARLRVAHPQRWVCGGVGLMSSDRGSSGARYWFSHFEMDGAGARQRPERGLGPIVSTLFTVCESGLKLTAQLMPVDRTVVTSASLQVRDAFGAWRTACTATLGPGYTALFRVPGWDRTREHPYRVVATGYPADGYEGTIPAEPQGRELVVASLSCVKAAHRRLDVPTRYTPRLQEEVPLGLYTSDNVYFPHDRLAAAMAAHQPDLLVAHGDQLYQSSPTGVDGDHLLLDFLGKYLLWLWSFRELTRSVPTMVLTDDHDAFQSNLFGAGGGFQSTSNSGPGGYIRSVDWLNATQQMASGHNPDPVNPTPSEQQVAVFFGSFVYGGVSFAALEDRKFKSSPGTRVKDKNLLQLLGQRQERFLQDWAGEHPDKPKIVLTQTSFACLQTDEAGRAVRDRDTNGWPGAGRDRALRLIRAAGALVICGDQHLGLLTRHGIGRPAERTPDAGYDGPLQFVVPAGSASFQRWFEPGPLPGGGQPHTGEWVDAFDNPIQVLAVVQPSVTRTRFRSGYRKGWNLGDRRLKKEGYGIVRVDPTRRCFVLECWPWDVDPRDPTAAQYPGFPYSANCDDKLHPADFASPPSSR